MINFITRQTAWYNKQRERINVKRAKLFMAKAECAELFFNNMLVGSGIDVKINVTQSKEAAELKKLIEDYETRTY